MHLCVLYFFNVSFLLSVKPQLPGVQHWCSRSWYIHTPAFNVGMDRRITSNFPSVSLCTIFNTIAYNELPYFITFPLTVHLFSTVIIKKTAWHPLLSSDFGISWSLSCREKTYFAWLDLFPGVLFFSIIALGLLQWSNSSVGLNRYRLMAVNSHFGFFLPLL